VTGVPPLRGEATRIRRVARAADPDRTRVRVHPVGAGAPPRRVELPGELDTAWIRTGELPSGGEAALLRVRARTGPAVGPGSGPERVLKIYRTGLDPHRRAVWAAVRGISCPSVLELVEVGTAGGQDYEISPYYPAGSLEDLVDRARAPDLIHQVVVQVAAALVALHGAGILHRDVKLANLLVRSVDARSIQVVLGDFGISRVSDPHGRLTTAAGTPRAMPPESHLAGRVWDSPARDWWGLGIIVRELATGERLFAGVHDDAVSAEIAVDGVDVHAIEDERVRRLCRGLLTRRRRDRWGATEVQEWIAGYAAAPPRSRGAPVTPVTPVTVRQLAVTAYRQLLTGRPGAEAWLVGRMWAGRELDLVEDPALAATGARWTDAIGALERRSGALWPPRPSAGTGPDLWAAVTGLWLVTDPDGGVGVLDRMLGEETARLGEWAPTWWRELLATGPTAGRVRVRGGASPLDRGVHLAAVAARIEPAQAQAAEARNRHAQVREAERQRRMAWERDEAARIAGRPAAYCRAALRVSPWAAAAVVLLTLHASAVSGQPPDAQGTAAAEWGTLGYAALAVAAVGAHLWQEMRLAAEMGSAYTDPSTRAADAGRLRRRADRLGRAYRFLSRLRFRRRIQVGLVLLVFAAMVLAMAISVPALLQLAEIPALTWRPARRLAVWRSSHAEHRRATVGGAGPAGEGTR